MNRTSPTEAAPVIREIVEDMDKSRCSTTSEQTMQPSVDWLSEARQKATAERFEAERKRDNDRYERVQAATAAIDAAIAQEYSDRIKELLATEAAAKAAWAEAVESAAESKLATFPRGVVAEWSYPRRSSSLNRSKQLTGRIGRYEVRTRQSEFPANAGPYRLPDIGGVFIRVLKKDGTPGLHFEKVDSWSDWRPQEQTTPQTDK